MLDIAVLNQQGREQEMRGLADTLGFETVSHPTEAGMLLGFDLENRLSLQSNTAPGSAVFVEITTLNRAKGKDPLMKAIGYKTQSVFDATAGWATDAMHIASHKIIVTACERNPVVHALLCDGSIRCKHSIIDDHLSFIRSDSVDALESLTKQPEVVYLDPMYPVKPGSAAPKKELQILQELHGLSRYHELQSNQNEQKLLEIARKVASHRVVVKRPHHAPPITPNPSGAVSAKLVRFDLYPPI